MISTYVKNVSNDPSCSTFYLVFDLQGNILRHNIIKLQLRLPDTVAINWVIAVILGTWKLVS